MATERGSAVQRGPSAPRTSSLPAEEKLRRAQRLGHAVGIQHLASTPEPTLQRYYGKDDLVRSGGVPTEAKVSEDLNLVWEGRQELYATRNKIDEGNRVLERGSKIVLEAGPAKQYDLESLADRRGFHTLSFADYHQVVPRFNPKVPTQGENLAREVSPELRDSREEIRDKHRVYIDGLVRLKIELFELELEIERGRTDPLYAKKKGGLASLDPLTWFGASNAWLQQTEVRRQVLSLAVGEVRGSFLATPDPYLRTALLQRVSKGLDEFIVAERQKEDSIALPTDCGQVVLYVATGGKTVQHDRLDDNPDIGSNYYTELPKNDANIGWNVHWAGVILKGGPDNATLESAGGLTFGGVSKATWWMDLYGTRNVDQTFKKRLHQLHIERSRGLLDQGEQTKEVGTSRQQLTEDEKKVAGWTRLDSDR